MYEREVLLLYKYSGIKSFPVDLEKIVYAIGYRMLSYQEVCQTQAELKAMLKVSADAYLVRSHKTIYYNDSVQSKQRKRFSVAHELGHIVLLTDDEDVADNFASALLAPRPIIFSRQLKTFDSIAKTFNVSTSAANRAVIDQIITPSNDDIAMIDYFGERSTCPWPFCLPSMKEDFPIQHSEIKPLPIFLDPPPNSKRKPTRAESRRAKEIARYQEYVEWRMSIDPAYRETHTIF